MNGEKFQENLVPLSQRFVLPLVLIFNIFRDISPSLIVQGIFLRFCSNDTQTERTKFWRCVYAICNSHSCNNFAFVLHEKCNRFQPIRQGIFFTFITIRYN